MDAPEWIWHPDCPLSLHERATLSALLRYLRRDDESGQVWPSVETLARATGTSESTVKRAIGALQAKGLVQTITRRRWGMGRNDTNIYVLRVTDEPPTWELATTGQTDPRSSELTTGQTDPRSSDRVDHRSHRPRPGVTQTPTGGQGDRGIPPDRTPPKGIPLADHFVIGASVDSSIQLSEIGERPSADDDDEPDAPEVGERPSDPGLNHATVAQLAEIARLFRERYSVPHEPPYMRRRWERMTEAEASAEIATMTEQLERAR